MLANDPTYVGKVAAVTGSSIKIFLSHSISSGISIIQGQTYSVGQVGSFIRIPQGYQDLFGVVSDVGASAAPNNINPNEPDTGRWMNVQLVGEALGGYFERGISQYPNIGDKVHIAIESDLRRIYNTKDQGHIPIGTLSSAENIEAKIALNELITRHSAVLGSTGAGKSTTIASLLRSITSTSKGIHLPSARVLMLDIHGEYSSALGDVAQVFSVDPVNKEEKLLIPFWALDSDALLDFLTGGVTDSHQIAFTDKINELKLNSHHLQNFAGIDIQSITVDTPIPFSLKKMWHSLIKFETATFIGDQRDISTLQDNGDISTLTAPTFTPHAMGSKGPFINAQAHGIKRPLSLLRSKLLDRRYDFLLHPGPWEPKEDGSVEKDLDELLKGWLGGPKPITILDLSGVPSGVLEQLVGSILKIIYESLFWSREKTEGGRERPLLVVMEEAHRYLSKQNNTPDNLASQIVQKIAKEGRKYGVGAMIISQRPSEVNETILSQCGTFVALRLTNPADRSRIQGTLPDGLVSLMDALPILKTGEAIVTGEAAKLPMRCKIYLPAPEHRPLSEDPKVTIKWSIPRRTEGYDRVVASWRAQNPRAVVNTLLIKREAVEDESSDE